MKKQKKKIDDWLDTAQLYCEKTYGKTKHDFTKFTFRLKFASRIYHGDHTLQQEEEVQEKLKVLKNKLNNENNPTKKDKIKEKDDTLNSAKKLFFTREEIIIAFKKGIFP